MKELKNYSLNFLNDEPLKITKEQAESVSMAIKNGGVILVEGNVYLTHQVRSITRNEEMEKKYVHEIAYGVVASVPGFDKESPTAQDTLARMKAKEILNSLRDKIIIKSIPQASYEEELKARADSGERRAIGILGNGK